jgi:hypothetical protein
VFEKAVGEVEGATPANILGFTLEGDIKIRQAFDPDIMLLEVSFVVLRCLVSKC